MGTPAVTTMRAALSAILLAAGLLITVCEAHTIDRDLFQVERRGYRDPDDPRNLFAAMYGANFKRSEPNLPILTPEMYQHMKTMMYKRGLRDREDPRNLFHSIYGGVFRRR